MTNVRPVVSVIALSEAAGLVGVVGLAALAGLAGVPGGAAPRVVAGGHDSPPETRREDVVEDIHGTPVADPYRWLEDASDPEVQAWMDAQDGYARARLDALPGRDDARARLAALSYVDAMSPPLVRGDYTFWVRLHADREKPVYYVQRRGEPARVLLDPNQMSEDGSASIRGVFPSPDGALVAYKLSRNAADAATLYVRDVESRRDLARDVIAGSKYAQPQWTPDGSGFYFVGLPDDPDIPPRELPGRAEIRFHAISTGPHEDRLIHPATGDSRKFLGVTLSRDGRWLIVIHQRGWVGTDVYYRALEPGASPDAGTTDGDAAPLTPLVVGRDAVYQVEVHEGTFYLHTNDGAPRYRVVAVDPARPERDAWREIVPESADTLQSVTIAGGRLALSYLRDAHSALEVRELDGRPIATVRLPDMGTASPVFGEPDRDAAYLSFASFNRPPQIYALSMGSGELSLWSEVEVPFDPAPFAVEQVWFHSRDGTRVSMFVAARRDILEEVARGPRDALSSSGEGGEAGAEAGGDHPALLYGYGGFSISLTPLWAPMFALWLERGGILAMPNLRGGGEYGEDWHRAGMRENKQNVFDDFAAAARYLIEGGYTRPDRLAIAGGSNGGLLVSAAMTQHPELYRAVVCSVPLTDMVRYHLVGSGPTWIPEYGSPDEPAEFAYLYAYSPYHRVDRDVAYPALLMHSADSDDRVDPMHARKLTAQIQASRTGARNPAWLRIERNAGHGGADLVRARIERDADTFAFLAAQLGM